LLQTRLRQGPESTSTPGRDEVSREATTTPTTTPGLYEFSLQAKREMGLAVPGTAEFEAAWPDRPATLLDVQQGLNRTGAGAEWRHASMHLTYNFQGSNPEWMYNTFTAKLAAKVTFFAVLGTPYGYFGIQQVGPSTTKGKVIFSTWAKSCHTHHVHECPKKSMPVINACGADVRCTTFGGEGVGGKSYLHYNWEIGRTYEFAQKMTPKPGGRLELAAYFFDPSVGSWKLMAAMEVERTVGWNGIYSFLEQWTGAEPEAKRWGLYGPAFAKPTNGHTWEQVH
jgi:hypothetical protein